VNPKFWSRSTVIAPLLLIVAINTTLFFVFPKIGAEVGADTGTDGYKEIAENLVGGQGLTFSQDMRSTLMTGYMKREPIYPLLLALVLRITGNLGPAVLCLFQTSLALISCYLIYQLGDRVFGTLTATLASFVYALHPISFWYSTRFASETVALPAILLCLLSIHNFFADPTRPTAACAGLCIGIATLTKSACVTLLPLILYFAFLKCRFKRRQIFSYGVAIVLSFACIHSLWLMRNYAISGEIVPFTTMGGGMFFQGNAMVDQFDVKKHTSGDGPDLVAKALYSSVQNEVAAKLPQIGLSTLEARTDRQLMTMARQLMLQQPLLLVRKFLYGIYFIWFLSSSTAKSWGWMIFQMPLVVLALIGLYRQDDWNSSKQFLLCAVVAYIVPYTLLSAYARYGLPVMPIIFLFASDGLISLLGLDEKRRLSMLRSYVPS
jgi:4-amino-4-deoxy-L-arabinose transferase-like glycosyltransferase